MVVSVTPPVGDDRAEPTASARRLLCVADGAVLDILVQNRQDEAAARRFFRRLPKTARTVARVIVSDELRSYRAAHRQVMPSVEHRSHPDALPETHRTQ